MTRMRVIGGSARGLVLRGPERPARPTSGRVREALFAMLESAGADFERVVDLYAGSGALGIEALSRGAGHCVFVERDRPACTLIRANLQRARMEDRAVVVVGSVGRWRAESDERLTLVLADPPYDDARAWSDIERSLEGALEPGAMIALEHAARVEPPSALLVTPLWRRRRHGDSAIAIYRALAIYRESGYLDSGEAAE